MAFRLNRFGVALKAQTCLHHLSWEAPRAGLIHLRGTATPWLIKVLTRETQPEGMRTWGTLTYGGIDFRVRPPALRVGAHEALLAGSVLANICRRMPPEQFIHASDQALMRAWASDLLGRLGLESLALDAQVSDLTPQQAQRLRVASAIASAPQVLCLVGTQWCDDELLWDVISKAAQALLVLVATSAWPTTRRAPDEVIDLGDQGIYHAPDEQTRDVPAPSPEWMQWFEPERLAGMPRPGQEEEIEEVIRRLKEQHITHVLCLEEEHHHAQALEAAQLTAWHFPIIDMHAPSSQDALVWCERVEAAQAQGGCVAIHCKAGLGRTGTMATLLLMRRGYTLEEALMLLRGWRRHYVQTEAQLKFLRTWESDGRP